MSSDSRGFAFFCSFGIADPYNIAPFSKGGNYEDQMSRNIWLILFLLAVAGSIYFLKTAVAPSATNDTKTTAPVLNSETNDVSNPLSPAFHDAGKLDNADLNAPPNPPAPDHANSSAPPPIVPTPSPEPSNNAAPPPPAYEPPPSLPPDAGPPQGGPRFPEDSADDVPPQAMPYEPPPGDDDGGGVPVPPPMPPPPPDDEQ